MFGLFGTITAVEDAQRQLAGHLLRAASLLRDDPACLNYIVGVTGQDVSVFEVWNDKAAHAASLERDDVRRLIKDARPLIARHKGQTQMAVVGGKGVTFTD